MISPEDILQDVWIAAFAHYSSFNPTKPGALDRWLMGIANHKLIDALKTAGRLKRGGGVQHVLAADSRRRSLCNLFARVASPRRTPSRDVGATEAAHAVQIALSQLSDDRRTAIQLRYLEGQTRVEIARRMQKSEAAVNSLLFNGLREMRRWMGDMAQFFSDARSSEDAAQ